MTEYKDIYFGFYRIDKTSFHEKVRFYERHQSDLEYLPFKESLELRVDYLFALFEIGKYHTFLSHVDTLIEIVIIENIYKINGKNIFEDLLFVKGACLYNLNRYQDASKVVGELLKIKPDYPLVQKLYRQCLRRYGSGWYEINQGIAVVFLLSAISVVIAQLFIVDPFYEHYAHHVRIFRNTLFLISGGLLVFNELKIRRLCSGLLKK